MDLTAVLPALMEGIAQEVGVDVNELKVVLVGDKTQLDVKPFRFSESNITRLNGRTRSFSSLTIQNLIWR